jgi:large subunit ribosomal protein L15
MVVRRRKKSKRAGGTKTHFGGIGGKQKRGKGSKGGKGRAGHGKRAGHMKFFFKTRKKKGFTPVKTKKIKTINLSALSKMKGKEIDLTKLGYDKLLGSGKITRAITVKVKSFSKKAKEKIEKAGGTIG